MHFTGLTSLSGYDVVFAEVGWNRTLFQDIALLRGAARMKNKEWGVIIGWKYTLPPYLDTGDQIYRQIVDCYRAGAKYIVVFNYHQLDGNVYGIMTDEHSEVLEQFWNNIVNNSTVVHVQPKPKLLWFCQVTTGRGCAMLKILSGVHWVLMISQLKFGRFREPS